MVSHLHSHYLLQQKKNEWKFKARPVDADV